MHRVKRDVFANIYEHMVHERTRCLEVFRECHSLRVPASGEAGEDDFGTPGSGTSPSPTKRSPRTKRPVSRRRPPPGTLYLNKRQLERFLQTLIPDIKRSEINYVHAMVDSNDDGVIEFKEFSVAVKECRMVGAAARTGGRVLHQAYRYVRRYLTDNQQRVLSMFDKFDKDKSGYLEMNEVVMALRALMPGLTVAELRGLMAQLHVVDELSLIHI